jgi:hypothetical protein
VRRVLNARTGVLAYVCARIFTWIQNLVWYFCKVPIHGNWNGCVAMDVIDAQVNLCGFGVVEEEAPRLC